MISWRINYSKWRAAAQGQVVEIEMMVIPNILFILSPSN